jgi:undecaprenyl diphosphate synthase
VITHLACIMDGNRRWASKNGLPSVQGHQEGAQAVKRVIDFCLEKGISYLSLYTFSLENFKRSETEKNFLFGLLAQEAANDLAMLKEKKIRVRFIGDKSLFPAHLMPICDMVEQETAYFDALQINVLFCYGARQEIVSGIKQIIHDVKAGIISEDALSDESFKSYLWTGDMPDPDIVMRTGGAQRLSNFLLYQVAYSELYFLDCMWPEVQREHLERMMLFFNQCKRNFGK